MQAQAVVIGLRRLNTAVRNDGYLAAEFFDNPVTNAANAGVDAEDNHSDEYLIPNF